MNKDKLGKVGGQAVIEGVMMQYKIIGPLQLENLMGK